MRILILYATKHGTTTKCVEKLANLLSDEVETVNLGSNSNVNLNNYENIIIGSPIYANKLLKAVKSFCDENIEELKTKNLGLFVTCMDKRAHLNLLAASFPSELVNMALVKEGFGGGLIYSDMGFIERLLIMMIVKSKAKKRPEEAVSTTENSLMINDDAIRSFAHRYTAAINL